LVFGRQFATFAHLVIPIGVAQLLGAGVLGFTLFLKACSAGRTLLWYQAAFSAIALALSVGLAVRYGVQGAAWGFALAGVVCSSLMILLALRVGARYVHPTTAADAPAAPPR
jgi:hypothetical protein